MAQTSISASEPERASQLYQRGREAMDIGDHESAIRLFEESAAIDPHFKTLELLGECLLKMRRYHPAIMPLAAAVGLGNKPFRALYLLAQALDESGSRRNAIEKLEEAIRINPDYKAARELMAKLNASQTRY